MFVREKLATLDDLPPRHIDSFLKEKALQPDTALDNGSYRVLVWPSPRLGTLLLTPGDFLDRAWAQADMQGSLSVHLRQAFETVLKVDPSGRGGLSDIPFIVADILPPTQGGFLVGRLRERIYQAVCLSLVPVDARNRKISMRKDIDALFRIS